ncbi:MAG: Unknown protein [uncultured Thiotrichaceae bacterium]|uniref:Peptidoglycan binding-like domain-containing protein n=1 Tax=uncultured Thiotrichaceae bacterium TaxID=298394 RepID=A0A6S6SGK8_9GAMM|nr:MAG: Unknown protein [uncultured Thiotrichaceae bacterium]
MKHLKIASILSALFLTLAGCSQQQVADDGSSQVATSQQASSSQQVADVDADKACKACNAPKVEAVMPTQKPQQTVANAVPPKRSLPPSKPYQQRRHLPTIPSKKNASSTLVMGIQKSLKAKGFNPGNVDGVMGSRTAAALHAFQKANGLAIGDLNRTTMRKLGLMQ